MIGFVLCCGTETINQVIPLTHAPPTSSSSTVDQTQSSAQSEDMRYQYRSRSHTLEYLFSTLNGKSIRSRLVHHPLLISHPINREHIGSGFFGNVDAVRVTTKNEGVIAAALKISKPGKEIQLKEAFKNELRLHTFLNKALNSNQDTISRLKARFEITTEQVLNSAIMIRSYRTSHTLYPHDVVGAMPLIDCDGNLGDAFNRLLDSINANDNHQPNNLDSLKKNIRHLLMGLRDLAVLLSIYDACGITHNDIKPENIAIDRFGVGRLLDHGFAVSTNSVTHHNMGGTFAYSAPEKLVPGNRNDPRSDLFSFGRVLAEVFFGHVPTVELSNDIPKIKFDLFTEIEGTVEQVMGNSFVTELRHLIYPSPTNHHHALTSRDKNNRPNAFDVAIFLQNYCDHHRLGTPFRPQSLETETNSAHD